MTKHHPWNFMRLALLCGLVGCSSAQKVANRPVFAEPVEPAPAPGLVRAAMTKSRVTSTELEYEWQITGDRGWSNSSSVGGWTTLSGSSPMPGWERKQSSVRIARLYIEATHHPDGSMDLRVEQVERTPRSRAALDFRAPGTVSAEGSSTMTLMGLKKAPLSRFVRVYLSGVEEKPLPAKFKLADLEIPASAFGEIVVTRPSKILGPGGKPVPVIEMDPDPKNVLLRKRFPVQNGELDYTNDPEIRRHIKMGNSVSSSWGGAAHKDTIGFEIKP